MKQYSALFLIGVCASFCLSFTYNQFSQSEKITVFTTEALTSKFISGKAILKVNNQKFEASQFLSDNSTPQSVWVTNNMPGAENEEPSMAMSAKAMGEHQMVITIGHSGKAVNSKSLDGIIDLNVDNETPFVIAITMKGGLKSFTFSSGTVSINKLTPESISIKAEGLGLYADMEKQAYLNDQRASFEFELSFSNVMVDGKFIEQN